MNRLSWPALPLACVALIAGAMRAPTAMATGACPNVEIAAVVGPGAESARVAKDQAGRPIALAAHDLVSPPDLTRSYVNVTEGQVVLNLSFASIAAERVRDFTAANVGAQLALLIDGRVVKTVRVRDPIRDDGVLIGPVERVAAETLSAQVNRCAAARSGAGG